MVGEREREIRVAENLRSLGEEGAFYRFPKKLAITACSDRRLRCKCTGDSGQGRRFRTPSGVPPDWSLVPHHTLAKSREKLETGDSGPCGLETRDHLRCTSGPLSRIAPQEGHLAAKNNGPDIPGPLAGDSGGTGDSGPSPVFFRTRFKQ